MSSAATELAAGILSDLYACRECGPETVLEESPGYAAERASEVLNQCRKLGIELPMTELLELMPDWDTLLR